MLRDKDTLISETKTDEDILHEIILRALRKYKEKDIDEEEGKNYLFKSLLMALHFKHKRRDNSTIYINDLPEYFDLPDLDYYNKAPFAKI